MNLWLSSHFLVAGLFLSSSALTPEECQPLITPLSLADPAMMYGRFNFIMGYTDNEVYNDIMRMTQSMWMNVTPSPSGSNTLIFSQENKINGTCVSAKVNTTIDGNTGTTTWNGTSLEDSHLDHFKRQASCLGFSKDPDFIYDPKNGFCAEGEGRKIFGN
ncbi:hypothetical protein VZT92_015752 [Zoarces viviparus]|uniref:Lipocalin n=1 Tax=Zoarces viviparus TaxID=48416 RepID=A0AAW1EWV3_ZOAVI